jgi:hypothetical protein
MPIPPEQFVTREERKDRIAQGLCAKCREKGHMVRNCPNDWVKPKKKEDKKVKEEKGKAAEATIKEVEDSKKGLTLDTTAGVPAKGNPNVD